MPPEDDAITLPNTPPSGPQVEYLGRYNIGENQLDVYTVNGERTYINPQQPNTIYIFRGEPALDSPVLETSETGAVPSSSLGGPASDAPGAEAVEDTDGTFSECEVGQTAEPCPAPPGVGQPGFAESLIPIWGSGRAAIDDFQNGRYGWAAFNTAMAISDVFLVKAAATAIVKGVGKATVGAVAREGLEKGVQEAGEKVAARPPIWTSNPGKGLNRVENAYGHWVKHGKEFPQFRNSKEYVEGAKQFMNAPPQGTLTKVRPNGDTLFYNPATNTFAVRDAAGAPRTMFKPNGGMNYWNKQ